MTPGFLNFHTITVCAIFKVVASGRNEAPCISDSAGGFRKLLDPYVSTYRTFHKPFSTEDQYGIGANDHITFYSEFNTPKVTRVSSFIHQTRGLVAKNRGLLFTRTVFEIVHFGKYL